MVISIGINGEIVEVKDAGGKVLEMITAEERDKRISSATKSTCQSITVHHLIENPIYVLTCDFRGCYITRVG